MHSAFGFSAGEYGQRQPFYFPLMPSYWFPKKSDKNLALSRLDYPEEDFEPISEDLKGKEAIRYRFLIRFFFGCIDFFVLCCVNE